MRVTITLENLVVRVVTAVTFWKHFARGSDVSAVEEYDGVEARDGGVHGGYACVGKEKLPRAWELSSGEEEDIGENDEVEE